MYIILDLWISLLFWYLSGYVQGLLGRHHPYSQQWVASQGHLMGKKTLRQCQQIDRVILVGLYITQTHPCGVGEAAGRREHSLTTRSKPSGRDAASVNILSYSLQEKHRIKYLKMLDYTHCSCNNNYKLLVTAC